MEGRVKLSREEKNLQTIYLFVLWIFFTALFSYVCFNNFPLKQTTDRDHVLSGIALQKLSFQEQKALDKHIDTLTKMLQQFNPGVSQVYLESAINYELEEIKRAYEKNELPGNHALFSQLKELYSMYYFDKKATWNTVSNTNFLKKNLQDCEVGFQQAQNAISLQNALQNNQAQEKDK